MIPGTSTMGEQGPRANSCKRCDELSDSGSLPFRQTPLYKAFDSFKRT
jgi:hypothetical protein